jgi:hypothetical protein
VLREWTAIPGHHGDVEDETVKRPQILWHAGLASLLTGGWSRPGQGRVEVDRRGMDQAEPREFRGTILVVFSLEGISGGIVPGMTCTVTSFHRPFRDGRQKVSFDIGTASMLIIVVAMGVGSGWWLH